MIVFLTRLFVKPEHSFPHSWLYNTTFTVQKLILYFFHTIWNKIWIWTFLCFWLPCSELQKKVFKRTGENSGHVFWSDEDQFSLVTQPNVEGNNTRYFIWLSWPYNSFERFNPEIPQVKRKKKYVSIIKFY